MEDHQTIDIPDDMIYCILEFVDPIDRVRLMIISKTFYRISLSIPLSLDLSFKRRIGEKRLTFLMTHCKNTLINLTSLNLSENALPREVIESLCASSAFPNLKKLNLSNNPVQKIGASFLGTCSKFQNLEELNLNTSGIDNISLRLISVNENLALSLRSLLIGMNSIGETGVKFMCRNMVHLTKLDISKSNEPINNQVIENISNSLKELTYLSIHSNNIRNPKEIALNLKKLTYLDMSNCSLGNSGFKEFVDNSELVNLEILNLQSNNIDDIEPLYNLKAFPALRMLSLSNNSIGESFEKFIAHTQSSNPLPSLEVLFLTMCSITEAGANLLSTSLILQKLTALNLTGNNIGNAENLASLENISTAMVFANFSRH